MVAENFNPAQVDPEFLREFLIGCEEHLSAAEVAVLELEKRPLDTGLINDIFRHFHSLKGDSASIGAEPIRDLAHELESLLDRLRNGELRVTAPVLDLLLEGVSVLANQVAQVSSGEPIASASELSRRVAAYQPEKNGVTDGNVSSPELLNARTADSNLGGFDSAGDGPVSDRTYIVFRSGNLHCTINVDESNEIIPQPHITPVPNVENYIAGVINLRGSIVPVIHLARRLGLSAGSDENPKILILIVNGLKIGLLVDEVFGVRSWNDARLLKPESASFELRRTFINGVIAEEGRIILLLNITEILKREK